MELGQIVMTRGIRAGASNIDFAQFVIGAFGKYLSQDWGDTCKEDAAMNDAAVKNGDDRVVAKYNHVLGDIFIITEWDRSVTTILLCNEY